MARLWSSGFEQNTLTTDKEWEAAVAGSLSAVTFRSGAYAGRVSSLGSGTNQRFRKQFKSTANAGPFYVRFYLRFAALPSAENRIFALSNSGTTGTAVMSYITVDNTGVLKLYDEDGQIGSSSAALALSTWYRIETTFDKSGANGSHSVSALVNGTQFAGASDRNISTSVNHVYFGGNLNAETQTTGDWFFDDCAINDSSGTLQNNLPGSGRIIRLKPNAAGDANTFATQSGGTVGAANNFTRVNEVTPDDATGFNGSSTLNEEDLYNLEASGLTAADIINVVEVESRFRNNSADAATAAKLEIEKTASSTITQSSAILPNSTTWFTNATTLPRLPILTLYQDPTSANWTGTTLDSMQVGYKLTTGGTGRVEFSAVWVNVDYTLQSELTGTSVYGDEGQF